MSKYHHFAVQEVWISNPTFKMYSKSFFKSDSFEGVKGHENQFEIDFFNFKLILGRKYPFHGLTILSKNLMKLTQYPIL